eukprot:10912666-Heterocapsa_arctica.AAC.1
MPLVSYPVSYPGFIHPAYLGFIPGFIPVSYLFQTWFRYRVPYLRFHAGFIPRFQTRSPTCGFIPVSWRTPAGC